MGIAFTGSGIAGMLCNPLAQWVINNYNWQTAYIVLGIIFLVVTLPFVLFVIKLHPSMKGLTALGDTEGSAESPTMVGLNATEAAKTLSFWILGICFFLWELIQLGIQNNIPIFLQDIGHTATLAATIMAVYMGLLVLGKLIFGSILDKWGLKIGVTFGMSLFVVALFALMGSKAMAMVAIFVVAFALASPMTTVFASYIVGDVFGNLDYGTIYGLMNIFGTLGLAVGMPLAGGIYEKTGSLVPTWYLFIALAVAVLVMVLTLLSRKAKLQESWHSQDSSSQGISV